MVVRGAGPLTAAVDDEILMLSPEQGAYFGLNEVGARVWELMASPRSVAEVRRLLAAEYEIDERVCRADTIEFLRQLEQARLIDVDP